MNYQLNSNNIYISPNQVTHRDEEYDQDGFALLFEMQERHFWYRGRHRFFSGTLDRHLPKSTSKLKAIDLGGGGGGWLRYLANKRPGLFSQVALADSSLIALENAAIVLPQDAQRYQIDLMNLHMHEEWDVAFLFDVIEHLPDDKRAMEQVREALKPGGLLFVATPAIQCFWSYNDEFAHHLRRYTRADYKSLATKTGFTLLDARYFMFFLSPLYLLSRLRPRLDKLSEQEKKELFFKQHQTPSKPINATLSAIFAAETPVGHLLRFPWGTSVIGVFRK